MGLYGGDLHTIQTHNEPKNPRILEFVFLIADPKFSIMFLFVLFVLPHFQPTQVSTIFHHHVPTKVPDCVNWPNTWQIRQHRLRQRRRVGLGGRCSLMKPWVFVGNFN